MDKVELRHSVRSSTPCGTECDSGRACGCLRWARDYAALPTTSPPAGAANGERIRQWFQTKQAGWYAVLADPRMPVTSTLLDQAHNTLDRKLFMMKGFHHPRGNQQAFLPGLAHLYNLIPISVAPSMQGSVAGSGRRTRTHS